MKKIFSLAVAALFVCTANAQDYNRVTVAYQNLDLNNNTNISSVASIGDMDGFKVGYTHGFNLTSKAPLYLEVGADFIFNIHSSDVTYTEGAGIMTNVKAKHTGTTCGLTIPVSLAYKFNLGEKWWIEPFAGANVKFNFTGRTKYKYTNVVGLQDADMDWFKEEDMSRDDLAPGEGGSYYNYLGGEACKRVQFGGQFGVNVGYKRFNLNVAYQIHSTLQKTDNFTVNTRAFTFGVGYNF